MRKYDTPIVDFSEIRALDVLTLSATDNDAGDDNIETAPDDWFN